MLSILNSVSSLNAENAISNTTTALNKNLQQLSTGLRVNSGADDAAGLSIANGLQANVAALTQSSQNTSDGVGMLQTADGALSQVVTLLNRAVTLATEASNGGLSTSQSLALNNEYASIQTEIGTIAGTTDFNGTNVFTNAGSVFTSDGSANGAASISTSVGALSATAATGTGLGLGLTAATATTGPLTGTGADGLTGTAAVELGKLTTAIGIIAGARGTIGATVNQLNASQSVEGAAVTNLTSALDSIQNADIGQTVAQMTQNSILEQTGMAALSQSNQMEQNVLKLVQ